MDYTDVIHRLKDNRLMYSEQEIILFEEALEEVANTNDDHLIGQLMDVLDDETEHEEVMWGLIHTIEYLSGFSPKRGLKQMIAAVPMNIEKSREWMVILHYRIFNHDDYRNLFIEALKEADIICKSVVLNLLEDIKDDNPSDFTDKVEEVKKGLCT
ncbi:MAG: Imm30 family immunity protein [Psychrobacillus sp.]